MSSYTLPTSVADTGSAPAAVIFVPCAKTKPWDRTRIGLYGGYNEVRRLVREGALPPILFVTISEPLGIVPEEHWGDFPSYDNPGLFRNDAQRAGLMTSDWAEIPGVGEKYIVPFDQDAYNVAIDRLAVVIRSFTQRVRAQAPGIRFYSFVDNRADIGGMSSHTDMLIRANALPGGVFLPDSQRFVKRPVARQSPAPFITETLRGLGISAPECSSYSLNGARR